MVCLLDDTVHRALYVLSHRAARAGAAACKHCGGAGGGSEWAKAFAAALCEVFDCPASVRLEVRDTVNRLLIDVYTQYEGSCTVVKQLSFCWVMELPLSLRSSLSTETRYPFGFYHKVRRHTRSPPVQRLLVRPSLYGSEK